MIVDDEHAALPSAVGREIWSTCGDLHVLPRVDMGTTMINAPRIQARIHDQTGILAVRAIFSLGYLG
jgi:hypothetical protein